MRVKVNYPKYFYGGVFYHYGDVIENYKGQPDKYLIGVRGAPKKVEVEVEVKAAPEPTKVEESHFGGVDVVNNEPVVLATFSEDTVLSPEAIRAKIAEVEAQQKVVVEKQEPSFSLVELKRGWYEVKNTISGKIVSDKKLRKDDAETLIEQLNSL